jgi:hypothetical protein
MRIKSHYPPICFESPVTGKKWIVCTGKDSSGWIEVNRWYGWAELESMWDKIEYGMPKSWEQKVKVKKEYKVKGSKGNVYKVKNDDGIWSCSCPAHGFGRGKDCKHIIELKNKNK